MKHLQELQEEEESDDSSTSSSDFEFIKDWPVQDPELSLIMEGATTEEIEKFLDEQPHVAHIYKTQEIYASFVSKCMSPCIGLAAYRSYVTGAKSLEECFTVEDEAMCLLVLVNSYRKWKDEARWRLQSYTNRVASKVPEEIMRSFSKSLYTESNVDEGGKRTTRQGWSHEGQAVFILFKRAVALKRKTFPNIEEYKRHLSDKICRKGKRKAQRELIVEEPKTKQYLAFISMADDMNGCIV